MRPPIQIDEATFNDRVARLIKSGGNAEAAGLTLEDVADMVHTRLLNVSPQVGESTVARAGKGQAKATKLKGAQAMDDLLG